MADGSLAPDVSIILAAVVAEAMTRNMSFNALRRKVAAAGKAHGVFIYGTDRLDGIIYVTYDSGDIVTVKETVTYSLAVSVSTW